VRRTIGTVLYAFHILLHPFDGFWDLKHEKKNTFSAAFVLLGIVVFAVILRFQAAGYLFRPEIAENASLVLNILTVIGPVVLWTVVNWAITTLFDGKASMKMIFIATVFSLTPFLLFYPQLVLTHVLLAEEGNFIGAIDIFVGLWTVMLLLIGNLTIQEYSMKKTIAASIATIVGVAAFLFLGGVFYSAVSQLFSFFATLIMEIQYW